MTRSLSHVLVTGGAGFIGSNFIRLIFDDPAFSGQIINLDLLTYAGNLLNLSDISECDDKRRYRFIHGDIQDRKIVERIFEEFEIDTVVNFAAESHVDRSIVEPDAFIRTNIIGTHVLLDVARARWKGRNDVLFHHISTDEVFGSLSDVGYFTETTPYAPRSPYSASKAASDHLAMAYFHTYGLPVTISNCSNNYGPYQFPEKLIPLMILNMVEGKPLPVYGDGLNIRDWLHVADHCSAIIAILRFGVNGETYNVGGENEWQNIKLVTELCRLYSSISERPLREIESLLTYVKDRPGHDRRYAINCSKIKTELGWERRFSFEEGLKNTLEWYLTNTCWVDSIMSGEYRRWLDQNYERR